MPQSIAALRATLTAPVVSFRDPLYAGVQVGLPCPPPSTVAGMLAAAAGGWPRMDPQTVFAMAFSAQGSGVDLETYHPLDATGKRADAIPKDRAFLAAVTLTVWMVDDLDFWHRVLRRPAWPLRLGRSQDLLAAPALDEVRLTRGQGRQRNAIVPADRTTAGTLLRLPTAISIDRSRTRWEPYRYHSRGSGAVLDDVLAEPDGQAVVPLPQTHPAQFEPSDT